MQRRTFGVLSTSRNVIRKPVFAPFHTSAAHAQQAAAPSSKPVVTVFGSGFVGRNVAKKVAPHAESVVVASRSGDDFKQWLSAQNAEAPLQNVRFEQVDVKDPSAVDALVSASQVVVNAVGIQYEAENTYVESFIFGSKNIAHSTSKLASCRLLKISTLGADVDHPSRILDMDYRGEDISFAANPMVTVLRSSVMFGKGKNVLSAFAKALSRIPFFSLPNCEGRFQPVWVEDVAQAVVACMKDANSVGKLYELGGPQVFNMRQLVKAATRNVCRSEKSVQIPLPNVVVDTMLAISQLLPNPSLIRDHLPMIHANMTVTTDVPEGKIAPLTFADLGITPSSMDSVFGSKQ